MPENVVGEGLLGHTCCCDGRSSGPPCIWRLRSAHATAHARVSCRRSKHPQTRSRLHSRLLPCRTPVHQTSLKVRLHFGLSGHGAAWQHMTSAVVEHGSEAGDEGDETKIDTVVYRQPSRRLAPGALHREATAPMRDARSVHARVTRCACYLERGTRHGATRATPVAPGTRRFRRDLHSPKRIARHGQRLALWVGCPMTEWRAWAHSRGLPSCTALA